MAGKVTHLGGRKTSKKQLLLAVVIGLVLGVISAKYCPWIQNKFLQRMEPPISSDAKIT